MFQAVVVAQMVASALRLIKIYEIEIGGSKWLRKLILLLSERHSHLCQYIKERTVSSIDRNIRDLISQRSPITRLYPYLFLLYLLFDI